MILADIGNTYFHVYDGQKVEHLAYNEAIESYKNEPIYYISVKEELLKEIKNIKKWKDISSMITIEGEYETMGIDRKALCLSHNNGIFIDAGSAITVDIVEEGVYKGGFILLGLNASLKAYEGISLVLKTELNKNLVLNRLPKTTKDAVSYGIIASIKSLIDKHLNETPLYFTGGDGKFLSQFFKNSIYDERLVFKGMKQCLKDKKIC